MAMLMSAFESVKSAIVTSFISENIAERFSLLLVVAPPILLLIFFWALCTGALLGSMFRSPMASMGVEFSTIYFSPLRLSIVITDIVVCAQSCSIFRSILISFLPSADVKTTKNPSPSTNRQPSTMKIKQLLFQPSITLFWISPITKNKSASNSSDPSSDRVASISSMRHRLSNARIPVLAPIFQIEVREVHIELDKLYLAPLEFLTNNNNKRDPQHLPSSLLATSSLLHDHGVNHEQYATFFEDYIALSDSGRANSATHSLEQWFQKQHAEKNSKKAATSNDNNGDFSRAHHLVKIVFRLLLSSFSFTVFKFQCFIFGASGKEVAHVNDKNNTNKHNSLVALAGMPRKCYAATEIGYDKLELFFHGSSSELLISIKQCYIQVGIPNSKKKITNMAERRPSWQGLMQQVMLRDRNTTPPSSGETRTWSYIFAPSDGLLNLSGMLELILHITSYDGGETAREKQLLGLTFTFLEQSLHLEPEPIHTFFHHFEDYLDSSSPFNEWKHWYYVQLKNPSSSQELQLRQEYRKYYERLHSQRKGTKRKSRKEKNDDMHKDSEDFGLDVTDTASTLNSSLTTSASVAQQMVDTLEKQMTFERIMDERRIVMGKRWEVPEDNAEFNAFLQLNRMKESGVASKKEGEAEDALNRLRFDRLIEFVEQKTSIMAALFTITIFMPSYRLVLAPSNKTRSYNSDGRNFKKRPTEIVVDNLYTKLQLRNSCLPNPQSSYFLDESPSSDSGEKNKPRSHFKLVLSIDKVNWLVARELPVSSIPSTAPSAPSGLVYKHPAAADVSRTTCKCCITLSSSPETSVQNTHLMLEISDILFLMIPNLLFDSLETLLAVSALPYNHNEKKDVMTNSSASSSEIFSDRRDLFGGEQDLNIRDQADVGASEEVMHATNEESSLIGETEDQAVHHLMLGGIDLRFSVDVHNCSVILLMHGSDLDESAMEINAQHAALALVSSIDTENMSFAVDQIAMTACRVIPTVDGLQIRPLPLKEALLIDTAKLLYTGNNSNECFGEVTKRNTSGTSKKVRFASADADSKPESSGSIKLRVNATVSKVVVNISPTAILVLSGFSQSFANSVSTEGGDKKNPVVHEIPVLEENEAHAALNDKFHSIWESSAISKSELKELVTEILGESLVDGTTSKKSEMFTSREFQRELHTMENYIDNNFQDNTIDSNAIKTYIQLQRRESLNLDPNIQQRGDLRNVSSAFTSNKFLGVVHYDDLREYTSTVEVYRITGAKEKENFPPVINWRQGKGSALFWDLYLKETGCSTTSMNGQNITNVQTKLVRALCNYEFAKYCWKVLVRPNLQELSSRPFHQRRRYRSRSTVEQALHVTDWVLDGKTSCYSHDDAFRYKMRKLVAAQSGNTKQGAKSFLIPYDLGFLLEVEELICTVGTAISVSKPLMCLRISKCNSSANLSLHRSSPLFSGSDTEENEIEYPNNVPVRNKGDAQNDIATDRPTGSEVKFHFEVTVEASCLNTKHNITEILVEPFFCFANGSHKTNKATFCGFILPLLFPTKFSQEYHVKGADTETVSSSSFVFYCPQYLIVNTSPALFETFNFVKNLVESCTQERFEEIREERLSKNSCQRANKVDSLGNVRLKNSTGQTIKFCSCKAYQEHGDAALEPLLTEHSTATDLATQISSGLRSQNQILTSGLSLSLPRFDTIHNIPIVNFQRFMVNLTPSGALVRQSLDAANVRKSRKADKIASGFAPLLTISSVTDILDTTTLKVRSSVVVEVSTPIDFRIVRITANKPYRGHDGINTKRLLTYMDLLGEGGVIVYETLRVHVGKRIPIPLHILMSSSLHMLYFRDVGGDVQRQWRAGILLHCDFLSNEFNRTEISRYHAKAGICIARDPLRCLQNTNSVDENEFTSGQKIALDTVIRVLPTFILRNSMPFELNFKCWQSSGTGNQRSRTTKQYLEVDTIQGSDITTNLLDESHFEKDADAARHTSSEEADWDFFDFGHIAAGCHVNLNGVDMSKKLFLKITQTIVDPNGSQIVNRNLLNRQVEHEFYWTSPIQLDVDWLQAGGNVTGRLSLPEINAQLGDFVDVSLQVAVELNGTASCTLFSPYWVINKSLMKMEYKFTGQDTTKLDSAVGGLPILARCNEQDDSLIFVGKREIAALPIERPNEITKRVWWDKANGELMLKPPLLRNGSSQIVKWSESIALDEAGTTGEIRCGEIVLASSIKTMIGAFYRSNLVTFQPRFIVTNQLMCPIIIAPVQGPHDDIKALLDLYNDHEFVRYAIDSCTLAPGQSTIIYRFSEVTNLPVLGRSRFICFKTLGTGRKRKWHFILSDSVDPQYCAERSDVTSAIIDIVRIENRQVDASNIFTLLHCNSPPLRVENRSNEHLIRFVQSGEDIVTELAPMTWCGYYWDNPQGTKALKVSALDSSESERRLQEQYEGIPGDFMTPQLASRLRSYKFLKVGKMRDLPCGDRSDTCLSAALRIIGGSRVLSFFDSSWRIDQIELGHLRRGGNWKNVRVDVHIEGVVLSLSDLSPREVLCTTVREISVTKPTGQVEIKVVTRHVQIDAMSSSARYPIMLLPLHLGVDRREEKDFDSTSSSWLSSVSLNGIDGTSLPRTYWDEHTEQPYPILEATISYLPQPSMLWFPEVAIAISPIKIQIDLEYVLKVVDLVLTALPSTGDQQQEDVSALLEKLNSPLKIPVRVEGTSSVPAYFESVRVNGTWFEIDFDLKPEKSRFSTDNSEDSLIVLTSMGRSSKSAISASLLSGVKIASAAFSHISPKFKFPDFVRTDRYCEVNELISTIVKFYSASIVLQCYKVLFSSRRFGEPTQLVSQYKTGIYEFITLTGDEIKSGGRKGVGQGVESLIRNVVGGTFDFFGKFTGSLADILEEIVLHHDESIPIMKITSSRPPEHFAEGFMQGSLFLTVSLTRGVVALVGDPYKGIKKRSPQIFATGLAKGATGLLASPIVGALGFTSKLCDGVKATTHMLEISVVESRCRPERIAPWGGCFRSIGIAYFKAIGIRIHAVRYQKKLKEPILSAGGAATRSSRSVRSAGDSKSARSVEAVLDEELFLGRKSRRLIAIRNSKGKFNQPSNSSSTPILAKQTSKDSTHNRYEVLFEETIEFRTPDMQFSDEIVLEFWKSGTYHSYARNKCPIATCSFTIEEAFLSLLLLRDARMDQALLQSTQVSILKPQNSGKNSLSMAHSKDQIKYRPSKPQPKIHNGRYDGYFEREKYCKDPRTHVVTPPIQEFSLKTCRTSKKRIFSASTDIEIDIQKELGYLKGQYTLMQHLDDESVSDTTGSDESSVFFGWNNNINNFSEKSSRSVRRKDEKEQLFGQVFISFVPIMW